MPKKTEKTTTAAPFTPVIGDIVDARPVPRDPALRIPENGRPGIFWGPDWKRRRVDGYVMGLLRDGDIELRPAVREKSGDMNQAAPGKIGDMNQAALGVATSCPQSKKTQTGGE
ncbi:hypothetical protein [Zavarzinia sp.]|uniref:hypothetical protein n=1 Tax=Zavarzinia sp. TaxID=2027920 RepID=UPI00356421A0